MLAPPASHPPMHPNPTNFLNLTPNTQSHLPLSSTLSPPQCTLPSAALPNTDIVCLAETSYVTIWGHLCAYLKHNLDPQPGKQKKPGVPLLNLGVCGHRNFNLGIKIPTFTASGKFMGKYGLRQKRTMESGAAGGGGKWRVEDMWTPSLASSTGLSLAQVTFALTALTNAIGKCLSVGGSLSIDFGIGVFLGSKCEIEFVFTQRGELPSPRSDVRSDIEKLKSNINNGLATINSQIKPPEKANANADKPSPRVALHFNKTDKASQPPTTVLPSQKTLMSWNPVFEKEKPENDSPTPDASFQEVFMRAKRAENDPSMPPLLDHFARLSCATVSGNNLTGGASDKIGSYFSPSAASLYLDRTEGRVKWVKGLVKNVIEEEADIFGMKRERLEREAAEEGEVYDPSTHPASNVNDNDLTVEPTLTAAGAERYMYYLGNSLRESQIAPFSSEIRDSLKARFEGEDESEIEAFLEEAKELHTRAITKAMLDYILMSEEERERLGIEEVPPDMKVDGFGWGRGKPFLRSPKEWRLAFKDTTTGFLTYAIIATPITIANALWQDFEHLRLVSVPGDYQKSLELGNETFTIVQFEQQQISHLNSVVDEFRSNWAVNLKHIFDETIESGDYLVDELLMKRYVDAMAVVMQTHLRSIVTSSIKLFVDFFEMFSLAVASASDPSNRETDPASQDESVVF